MHKNVPIPSFKRFFFGIGSLNDVMQLGGGGRHVFDTMSVFVRKTYFLNVSFISKVGLYDLDQNNESKTIN